MYPSLLKFNFLVSAVILACRDPCFFFSLSASLLLPLLGFLRPFPENGQFCFLFLQLCSDLLLSPPTSRGLPFHSVQSLLEWVPASAALDFRKGLGIISNTLAFLTKETGLASRGGASPPGTLRPCVKGPPSLQLPGGWTQAGRRRWGFPQMGGPVSAAVPDSGPWRGS